MNRFLAPGLLILTVAVLGACQLGIPTATPLPGWRSPVSNFLLDDSALPQGWIVPFPTDTSTDPTVNNIYRSWLRPGVSGTVDEQIWRSYSVSDAKGKYAELKHSQFGPNASLPASTFFVEFATPSDIAPNIRVADEFYFACGWWDRAYCAIVARYQNYSILLRMDRQESYHGHVSNGLTNDEIKVVADAMDTKAAQSLASIPTQSAP